ncbi:hypothetical protein KZ483_25950 [Paenibacillus sp. sptzw28]|uniref:hypothetical protein n=1 Tax=Paenibacillus sp. sptzw28 TaxID=715179 RepID=UPI001C6DF3CB|nr:hypothetical protein [Paenibacillus sp. sptzw28]QYR21118.1 hypothetical protein KZ483_25950 [Paenibacillus sp. sptzw28]
MKKVVPVLVTCLLLFGLFVSAVSASSPSEVSINVSSQYESLAPGQSFWVSVGVTGSSATLKSTEIVLSYDENVFTTDGAVRFDDTLGKNVWRGDMYYVANNYAEYSTDDYTTDFPYPVDLNPFDGKQEVVLTANAKEGKIINLLLKNFFLSP